MAEENRPKDDGGKKGTEFRVPPRTYILWIAILATVVLVEKLAGPRPRLNSTLALLLVFAGLGLSLEALWRR